MPVTRAAASPAAYRPPPMRKSHSHLPPRRAILAAWSDNGANVTNTRRRDDSSATSERSQRTASSLVRAPVPLRPPHDAGEAAYHQLRLVKVAAQMEHRRVLAAKGLLRANAPTSAAARMRALERHARSAPQLPFDARNPPAKSRILRQVDAYDAGDAGGMAASHNVASRDFSRTPPTTTHRMPPPNELKWTDRVNAQLADINGSGLHDPLCERLTHMRGWAYLPREKQRRLRQLTADAVPVCRARNLEKRRAEQAQIAAAAARESENLRFLARPRAVRALGHGAHGPDEEQCSDEESVV